MKLDPGIHMDMHSVLFLKPGVTDCQFATTCNKYHRFRAVAVKASEIRYAQVQPYHGHGPWVCRKMA
jgi:hypothetical protein